MFSELPRWACGDGNAVFNLGTGTSAASVRNTATAIALGGLAGGSGTQLQGNNSSAITTTYTLGGTSADAEFDGVIKDGSVATVALIKTGGNTQTFTNANTYSGGTTINGGTLQINNPGGSGTGSGAVTVNSGGTLGGNGIISGAVAVNSGGKFAPGNPLGTLTINNNLTLAAGSTTFVQIQHAPLTNDVTTVSGTLTEGGTLNVTNIGGALASGDSFKLFNAANYSGAFAGLVLPPLTGNLLWNTNTLKNFGTLSVVTLSAPTIAGIQISGGNLTFNGSGGVNNWPYFILASTNLALAQWTPVATNQFDAAGNFSTTLTNAANPGRSQIFFRLQLQ